METSDNAHFSRISLIPWISRNDMDCILCPECKYHYVHFCLPYMVPGNDRGDAWDGRGDLMVLPMWSECGSEWDICIGFDKGSSIIFNRINKSCKSPQSYIYFIEAIGLNRIKIGVSEDPKKRLKHLATGSPVSLILKGVIAGGHSSERELHRKFDHLRLDGEWFHATKELLKFIDEHSDVESDSFYSHGPVLDRDPMGLPVFDDE